MSIDLNFRNEGPAYERAKAVADAMGLSVPDYLLACIAEGHKVLRSRHRPSQGDIELPTFMRWSRTLD
ncbi:MAG: hypothetical protein K9G59_18955 [Caulobacter sp.]|nr:hypothetical protein [Caulobacter sp.]